MIESCPPPGAAKGKGKSHTIKSHHNVGGLPEDLQFQLIEPLRELFKVGGSFFLFVRFFKMPTMAPACVGLAVATVDE